MPGAIIIGAGPGIGASAARRFAREGLPVALVARRAETVDATARSVTADGGTAMGLTADSTDEAALRAVLQRAVDAHGVPDVLVYNAARIRSDKAGELSMAEHLDAWAVNVVAAITAIAHIAPRMAAGAGGTILLTGGMPEPEPERVSLSLGKAGIRALTELLAKQYGPQDIHVATVTVGGPVAPRTAFDPDEIADRYWQIHCQPRDAWEREVVYAG